MNLIDGPDPWERLIIMQQRIANLEAINQEIIKHIELSSKHVDELHTAITAMQKNMIDLTAEYYRSK